MSLISLRFVKNKVFLWSAPSWSLWNNYLSIVPHFNWHQHSLCDSVAFKLCWCLGKKLQELGVSLPIKINCISSISRVLIMADILHHDPSVEVKLWPLWESLHTVFHQFQIKHSNSLLQEWRNKISDFLGSHGGECERYFVIFWNCVLCSLVYMYQHYRGVCCLHSFCPEA